MGRTLDHYNTTADRYVQTTVGLDSVAPTRDAFLGRLIGDRDPRTLRVLDAGSGSGRDTLAFRQRGLQVEAFDGSSELAQRSTALTGVPTQVMTFEDLRLPPDHYDGIWAMASLLHVARANLPEVLVQLARSLKPGGTFLATFKWGQEQRVDPADGREFTDLDPAGLERLMSQMTGLSVQGTQTDEGPDTARGRAAWFAITWQREPEEPRRILTPVLSPRPSRRRR